GGRPVGIGPEAALRGQGRRQSHPRSRRAARPGRRPDVRRGGGGRREADGHAWRRRLMLELRVTVLGSTGSVGVSTLDLMDQAEAAGTGRVAVEALTAGSNLALLAEQACRWRPRLVVTADAQRLEELRDAVSGLGIEVAAGAEAIVEAASRPADWIMAAIVGAAGLRPAWAAAGSG